MLDFYTLCGWLSRGTRQMTNMGELGYFRWKHAQGLGKVGGRQEGVGGENALKPPE